MPKIKFKFDQDILNFAKENNYKFSFKTDKGDELTLVSLDGPSTESRIICINSDFLDSTNEIAYVFDYTGYSANKKTYLLIEVEFPYNKGDILVTKNKSIFMWNGNIYNNNFFCSKVSLWRDNTMSFYSGELNNAVCICDVKRKATEEEIIKFINYCKQNIENNPAKYKMQIYNDFILPIENKLINTYKSNDEFSTGEMVLCKNKTQTICEYELCQFAFYDKIYNIYHVIGGNVYHECIPYIGNEHIFERVKQYHNGKI